MSYRYPNCDDARRHQEQAREDARYGSYSHQPSPWDERDCRLAYDDARREEVFRREEREAEEARQAQYARQQEEAARLARQEAEREEEQRYQEEEYRRFMETQQPQEAPEEVPPAGVAERAGGEGKTL